MANKANFLLACSGVNPLEHEVRAGERELGSSLFASTLVIVSSWLDLGFTDEADQIRLQLVGR